MKKRVRIVFILSIVVLAGLCGRLYYIQVMCHEELEKGAQGQYAIQIRSEDARGTIYDRNLVRLTDSCSSYYYLLNKKDCTVKMETLISQIGGQIAGTKGDNYVVYKAQKFDRYVNEKLVNDFGAYVFCGSSRYDENQIAAHLIGYLNDSDSTGVSGLEKMFQDRLASSPAVVSMMGNGIGEPIKGIGITEQGTGDKVNPSALVTTVDANLQKKVEEILNDNDVSGAVVVLQVKTGQVMAMASSPVFDPNHLDSYLTSENGELINKAIQGLYPPGSVFKIVVAAAALESGSISMDDTFDCKGKVTINGVDLICEEKQDGHGTLDLGQAFAKSCNCYFAQLGKKTGSENIIEMARRMGLGKTTIAGFPDEEAGSFPDESEREYSGLSNLSIGQGSLLVTPIQIAKMTNIIANKGIDHNLSVIMSQQNEEDAGQRVLTEATATEVGEMMERVMVEGTAAGSQTHVTAAGQTGSAEAGGGNNETVHGWFTGYFPAENPEYTVTVIAENGKTGSSSALPVFEEIVNYLY